MRKTSVYLAIPATGNGGPARIIASRADIPAPTSGPTAAIRPAVEPGAVRAIVGTWNETVPALHRAAEAGTRPARPPRRVANRGRADESSIGRRYRTGRQRCKATFCPRSRRFITGPQKRPTHV